MIRRHLKFQFWLALLLGATTAMAADNEFVTTAKKLIGYINADDQIKIHEMLGPALRGTFTEAKARVYFRGILAARAKTRVVQVSGETIEALRRGIELGHRASAAMCADGGQAQRERDEQVNYVFSLFVRDLERLLKDPLS